MTQPSFLFSLAASVGFYFFGTRLLQDVLADFGYFTGEIPDLFESFKRANLVQPEPLETPFYLLGYLIIPVLAVLFYKLWKRILQPLIHVHRRLVIRVMLVLAGIGLLLALAILIRVTPPLSAVADYVATRGIARALWLFLTKRLYFLIFLTATAGMVFVAVLLWGERLLFSRSIAHHPLFLKRFEPLILFFFALLVFHPNIPFDYHHYNYFLGPMNDVLHGKPLLYETTELYGLLNIYALAGIFSFVPLRYAVFSLVLFALFALYYSALYYFLRSWLSSRMLALAGSLAVVSVTYFAQVSPTQNVYFYPGGTPLRFGFEIAALFLVLAFARRQKWYFRESALLCAAASLFWIFDNGAYLFAATVLTFSVCALTSRESLRARIMKTVKVVAAALAYVLGVFAVLNALNYAVFGAWPDWFFTAREILPFLGGGVGMFPLPPFGVFEAFIFIYLLSLVVIAWRYRTHGTVPTALLFLTFYGIFSLNYYIGRSIWQNLPIVSVPGILILTGLVGMLWEERAQLLPVRRTALAGATAVFFFAGALLAVKLPIDFSTRDYKGIRMNLTEIPQRDRDLAQDARELARIFPHEERIPLVHLRDTPFLIYAGRANFFDFYYIDNLYFKEEMQKIVEEARAKKPPQIAIGKEKNDQIRYFEERIKEWYAPRTPLRTLEIWTRK